MNTVDTAPLTRQARIVAAKFVIGTLSEAELRGFVESLMYHEIWHDDFTYVLDGDESRVEYMEPAVAACMACFGLAMPDKPEAARVLLEQLLEPIASGEVDALDGLNRFMEEFYWGWAAPATAEDFGESLGVRAVVMDWYQLDDWLGFMPDFVDNPAQARQVADLKNTLREHARMWLREHETKTAP